MHLQTHLLIFHAITSNKIYFPFAICNYHYGTLPGAISAVFLDCTFSKARTKAKTKSV